MAEKKIYCGSGKKQSDTWLKVSINPDKLKDYIQEYQGSKFVKLNINIYDEPNEYGKDVSITIDTWKKDEGINEGKNEGINDVKNNDDLPF